MVIISGCLSGDNCFYNGTSKENGLARRLVDEKGGMPVCPELLGGLSVPRERTEINGGTGMDVLRGECRVMTESGSDVTACFVAGANAVLSIAKKYNVKKAVFKSRSPSCGCGEIYDGSFTGRLIKGDGVTCALLKMNGVEVMREWEFLKSF